MNKVIYFCFFIVGSLVVCSCDDTDAESQRAQEFVDVTDKVSQVEPSDFGARERGYTKEEVEAVLKVGMSKSDVLKKMGDPNIDAGGFFVYNFWDKSDLRNIGRDGPHCYSVRFENDTVYEITWVY